MKMKRTMALILAGLLGISAAACGAKGTDGQASGGSGAGADTDSGSEAQTAEDLGRRPSRGRTPGIRGLVQRGV